MTPVSSTRLDALRAAVAVAPLSSALLRHIAATVPDVPVYAPEYTFPEADSFDIVCDGAEEGQLMFEPPTARNPYGVGSCKRCASPFVRSGIRHEYCDWCAAELIRERDRLRPPRRRVKSDTEKASNAAYCKAYRDRKRDGACAV